MNRPPLVHSNDHQPTASLYTCFECGRSTLKLMNRSGSIETHATSFSREDVQSLVSRLKMIIKGDILSAPATLPQIRPTGAAGDSSSPGPGNPEPFPYSDPSA